MPMHSFFWYNTVAKTLVEHLTQAVFFLSSSSLSFSCSFPFPLPTLLRSPSFPFPLPTLLLSPSFPFPVNHQFCIIWKWTIVSILIIWNFSIVSISICEDLSATLTVVSLVVIFDECPVHNMVAATWIHLLTKVQQLKLIRSSFRCCAWLEKEWH